MSGPRRLVAYLRVAPREPPETRPDLELQRREIIEAAATEGWQIVAIEQDVRSGRSPRRPGLMAALDLARSGSADGIIVARLDRLTYSLPSLARLMHDATSNDFAFVAVQEALDTRQPDGALAASVLSQASRWNPLPVEVNPGPLLRRRGRPSSTPAAVAERIRGMRQEGMTLQAICDVLNADGVPTPRGGATWRPTSLRAILRDRGLK